MLKLRTTKLESIRCRVVSNKLSLNTQMRLSQNGISAFVPDKFIEAINAAHVGPSSTSMARRPESTLKRDLFRRRHRTVVKKANQLAMSCGAHVYVVVHFHGQYQIYTSHKHRAWPPSEDQIVGTFNSRLESPANTSSSIRAIPYRRCWSRQISKNELGRHRSLKESN